MAIEIHHETLLGPKALLAHLRDHPEARFRHPRELAQEFGLQIEFVEQVLAKAESHSRNRVNRSEVFWSEVGQINRRLKTAMDNFARHPTVFVIGSSLVAEIILVLLSVWYGHPLTLFHQTAGNPGARHFTISAPSLLVPLTMVLAQMVLFFRRGLVRFALYGALAFYITGGIGVTWTEWAQEGGLPRDQRIDLCLLVLFTHLVVSMVYAAAGSFVSLMGEYQKVLRENRRIEKMTRQELLERLFQLQARMDMAKGPVGTKIKKRKLTEFVKGRLFVAAALSGLLLQLISNLAVGAHVAEVFSVRHVEQVGAETIAISTALLVLLCVANFWLAYLAQNLRVAIVVGVLFTLGGLGAKGIVLSTQNHHVLSLYFLLTTIGVPIRDVSIAAIAGIIAQIQTRTLDDLNIQKNDEATLIAEQLKIQWRLAEDACSTTVMVIDVVKSTQMKEGADPLAVEYSFRRLQEWIADISAKHGGGVRSTAGDSAVVSFQNCHNAFLAAAEVQRKLPDFNADWNRLDTQFRVRCGLHVGEVQGDLGKIQFAQVIDIAAHMQKMAPAGGIAATMEVVSSLGRSSFVPLAIKSDGHDVFLALDPNGL